MENVASQQPNGPDPTPIKTTIIFTPKDSTPPKIHLHRHESSESKAQPAISGPPWLALLNYFFPSLLDLSHFQLTLRNEDFCF